MELSVTQPYLLLLGMDAFQTEACGGVARAKWVTRALVEEMTAAMPPNGEAGYSLDRYHDAHRGVSDKLVDRATNELLDAGLIEPRGVGNQSAWVITPLKEADVSRLWATLDGVERHAIRTAAHRTFALVVAWSKTRRASMEPRSDTRMS